MKTIHAAAIALASTFVALPAAAGTLVVSPSGKTITNDGLPGQAEIKGVGFRTADRIAQEAGIPKDDPARSEAAARSDGSQIWFNTPHIVYPGSSWGGAKASGIWRKLGARRLHAYVGVKHITLPA